MRDPSLCLTGRALSFNHDPRPSTDEASSLQRLQTGGLDLGTSIVPLGHTICAGTSPPDGGSARGARSENPFLWHVLLAAMQLLPQGIPFLQLAAFAGTSIATIATIHTSNAAQRAVIASSNRQPFIIGNNGTSSTLPCNIVVSAARDSRALEDRLWLRWSRGFDRFVKELQIPGVHPFIP